MTQHRSIREINKLRVEAVEEVIKAIGTDTKYPEVRSINKKNKTE